MSRPSNGALTGWEVMRLEMSLIKTFIPKQDGIRTGVLNWSNGSEITYSIKREATGIVIGLSYTITRNGEKEKFGFYIDVIPTPSNLGKGNVYHFVCPVAQVRAKILYLCYGSNQFMSRAGYLKRGVRIYYPMQLKGYYDKPNDNYWYLERFIKEIEKKHPKSHYRGKVTKPQQRINRLRDKRDNYDTIRWHFLPKKIKAMLPDYDIVI